MNNLKKRLQATALHFLLCMVVSVLAALLVFCLWYPYPYREISGGRELFLLVVAVDVIIGPLITLIIFNSAKPRRELIMDLALVGSLQLAALSYGLWTVFVARPVHLVFEYSRLSVVHAIDVSPELLQKAPTTLQKLPLTGPTTISLRPFKDVEEQIDATIAAMGGATLAARSDLWEPYEVGISRILQVAKPVEDLTARFPEKISIITAAIDSTGQPMKSLRYIPMLGHNKAWTALLDATTAEPVGFLPIDSF